jgi:very-short-patch-repair endonuclease
MPKGLQGFQKGHPQYNSGRTWFRSENVRGNTFRLGLTPWNKGKPFRCKDPQARALKISRALSGRHQPKELNEKRKQTLLGHPVSASTRTKLRLRVLQKAAQGLLKRPLFDTDIEIKMQQLLTTLGIKFEKQKVVADIAISDLYLPDYDLYIFCDGDYWHEQPHMILKDQWQNLQMANRGIRFIRFRGKEIMKNSPLVIKSLTNTLTR